MKIDLGWHWQLVTKPDGGLVWAWAHWSKQGLLGERVCDGVSCSTEKPEVES